MVNLGVEYYNHIKMQLGRDPVVFVDGVPVDQVKKKELKK